jgi:hypothetical protein
MKDFKKMPKMACGGGVGKYSEGGNIVEEARNEIRSGKDLDPKFSKKLTPYPSVQRGGKGGPQFAAPGVEMPNRMGSPNSKLNIEGLGEIDRSSVKGLKAGSKVKRGKVTKKK